MEKDAIRQIIEKGQAAIGIELGSTRIKTVLIGPDNLPIASGGHDWQNQLVDGIWTYSLDAIWQGLQASYRAMTDSVKQQFTVDIKRVKSLGLSGMMHGYMVFDENDQQLVPFRTWRNTMTGQASHELTDLFNYPIPQRWNIAHLYQAILNGEPHVASISHLTTLAGYLHWQLTGRKALGVGEASGMFPIDLATKSFNSAMAAQFDAQVANRNLSWKLLDILPEVLAAGETAGILTEKGARLLDPTGVLQVGVPLCPPEGDAGTGMVATNSIAKRTGNVSAGTSVFAMIVLEKDLSRAYHEIDQVTTPDGSLVAMVHSNNCTSDYDAWMGLFGEAIQALGFTVSKPQLYDTLLGLALKGDPDCGGLLAYGYLSGEHITGLEEGRPLFARTPDSRFNLPNFMRVHLYTALGALKTGLDILLEKEAVQVDEIKGHGGFFKTRETGQKIMAAATGVPVSVLETAGEGGAWGIALLGAYMADRGPDESLADYLNSRVFAGQQGTSVSATVDEIAGFKTFLNRYTAGLVIEQSAVDHLK